MQPMTQIGLANVKVFSGLEPDGEEYRTCRLTFLGDKVALWRFFEGRWLQVDVLSAVTVVDDVITGVSKSLVQEVGLEPINARVRWEIEEVGCRNCR